MASVFVIDDHPIVASGLKLGISLHDRFEFAGHATSHDRALPEVSSLAPDVIIVDLIMDGEFDLKVIALYREALPDALIAVFSSLSRATVEAPCRKAGANAFFSKDTSPHELLLQIAGILDGRGQVQSAPEASQHGDLILEMDGKQLTPRESEIARHLAIGTSIRQIAGHFAISPKTAAAHRDNIKSKLGCATTTELIALLARQPAKLPIDE